MRGTVVKWSSGLLGRKTETGMRLDGRCLVDASEDEVEDKEGSEVGTDGDNVVGGTENDW